jgi:hypothetical protein
VTGLELTPDVILEAGRAVRPYLAELPERPEATDAADDRLARALAEPEPAEAARAVSAVFEEHPAALPWLVGFTDARRPADLVAAERHGLQPLPGEGKVTRAPRYRCPHDDYTWYRRSAAQSVGVCPTPASRSR